MNLAPAVSSEWVKFRSVRSTIYALVVTVALSVGISALICFAQRQQWSQEKLAEHLSFDATATSLSGFFFAEVAIGVIGVIIMTSEYSSGSIRVSLLATPVRLRVLTAKSLVLFVSTLVVGELCSFTSFFVGQSILAPVTGSATLSTPGAMRAIVLGGISLALLALFALGIGTMIRHTAGSITVYVCCTFVAFLVVLALPSSWNVHVFRYLPQVLTSSMRSSHAGSVQFGTLFSPAAATVVLAGYAVAALVGGGIVLVRSDA
jgi:hypothetical protein